MSDLPAPPVPPEIDLRDFPFMPLDTQRLLSSETWVLGSAEEKVAAVALWCESWHQVPAASLPDNDRMLAHLSQAGPRWLKVKKHALRGWIKASDGRLYHPVVAEKALDAWERKQAQRSRTAAARAARQLHQSLSQGGTSNTTEAVTSSVTESVTASKGQGQGQGHGVATRGGTATTVAVDKPGKPDGKRLNGKNGGLAADWWRTNEGIDAMGRAMKFPPRGTEGYAEYKDRIFKEQNRRAQESPQGGDTLRQNASQHSD